MLLTPTHRDRPLRKAWLAVPVVVSLLSLTACGGGSSSTASSQSAAPSGSASSAAASGGGTASGKRIAFLAASSQNGYNQAVYQGVQEAAKKGGAEATIFDGQFDAQVQFNQLQDAATSGKFDAIVIVPNDTVGIAAAIPSAAEEKIPVVTALFPVGTDLTKLEPQVDGIVATVASPPAVGASKQAELVVDYCKDINPCKVAILIGQLRFPFDKLRNDSYRKVLDGHDNIKVVATAEGNYDREASLKAMTDVIQAHPDINVVLSNADQQTQGAQVALESAGKDLSKIYLTGGGGTKEAVAAVRAGKWKADYLQCPVSMGAAAGEQAIAAASGQTVKSVVDADTLCGINVFVDKATLDANPTWTGQWSG